MTAAAVDVVEEMKAFGLSTYEAHAYLVLVRAGAADASVVAKKANIPFGRVYDVLNTLVEKRLADVQDGRPKIYVAHSPRVGVANLLAARRRELDERASTLTQLANDIEKRLAAHAREKDSSFYAVAIGEANGRTMLKEKVDEARETIAVNLEFKRYDPADETLFEAFVAAVDRGVRVRVLVREDDIPHILESPYNDLIARTMLPHLGESLQVRIVAGDQVPFGIIDGEKALVAMKNPLDPGSYFALVFVWDPRFGKELAEKYEEIWRSALDVPPLVGVDP